MKRLYDAKRLSVVLYWAMLIALLGLFFTNDFGLVDIHKTAIISAVGIDTEDGEIQVTAQLALPQPSQSGDNIQYAAVQGSGLTVADAFSEINAKTGFYLKLLFCKLILLGESCKEADLFTLLESFYRKNYSELTAQVAMCEGKAAELIMLPTPVEDTNTLSVMRVLSDELKKSANASSVNLKDIALTGYSKSRACYMPYVEMSMQGTSESGGGGDSAGGDKPQEGASSSGGGSESGSSEGGESGGAQQGGKTEFTARKTALFSDGKFAGMLNDRQSFAFDLLINEVRLAVLPCAAEDRSYTLGLKNAGGGISLAVDGGVPVLTLRFEAKAQIQGVTDVLDPDKTATDDVLSAAVLQGAQDEIRERMEELVRVCVEGDCDAFGAKELLYKYHTKYYEAFSGDLLTRMRVEYDIRIKSVN